MNASSNSWGSPQRRQISLWLIGSIVIAMMLDSIALPYNYLWFWPRYLAVILSYWIITTDGSLAIGVLISAILGLTMDYITGTALGQQMLSYAIFARLVLAWQYYLRHYGNWLSTALRVFILLLILEISSVIVRLMIGSFSVNSDIWLHIITTSIIGASFAPFCYGLLARITNDD